jgi:YbbR domain-containing protein
VAPFAGHDPLGRTGAAVTRVLRVLIHNWPLKLAAVGLATLLYAVQAFSQSTQPFDGNIPVEVRGQPDQTFLLTEPEPVTSIRYISPSGARPITSTFEAWIDLDGIEPGSGPKSVPVHVRSIDDRISVYSSEPDRMTIELDKLAERTVPVKVAQAAPPDGAELGPTTLDPTEVTIIGPASVLDQVVEARANVLIRPGGFDVDQEFDLVPTDALGNAVGQVNVEPATARVVIPVFSNRASRTLTISPLITGDPAPGFTLIGATASPLVVTVEGDVDELTPLTTIDTAPISINGLSSDQVLETTLALPSGVVALDVETIRVSIKLQAITETRNFQVGLAFVGARSDRTYTSSTDRVTLTLGGSVADLDRLQGATLIASLDVTSLEVGTTAVDVSADLPAGVTLVTASPNQVAVTVGAPLPPSPSPGG